MKRGTEEVYTGTLPTGERLVGRIHYRHPAGVKVIDPQLCAGISVVHGGSCCVLASRFCTDAMEARGFLAMHGVIPVTR